MVVGVNKFQISEEEPYTPLRVDPTIGATQCEKLKTLRATRDSTAVDAALAAIKCAAADINENLLPPMKLALTLGATVGEVADQLRAVWGVYRPSENF